MTAAETTRSTRFPGGRVLSDGHVLYWWAEIVAILAYYGIYSAVRNLNGATRRK